MIVYIVIFGLTLFLYFYINGFESCRSKIVSKPKADEKSADVMAWRFFGGDKCEGRIEKLES